MKSEILRAMSEYVRAEGYDVRGMMILRHGTNVFEWYASGVTRAHNHNIYSVTKSVTATLAGIAVDQGLLSASSTLKEVFPDSPSLATDSRKAKMTLADLLTMRSGLPQARGNQPGPLKELFDQVHEAPNRTRLILGMDLVRKPGKVFAYGNSEPQLVLAIVQQATGTNAVAFATEHLFEPLGFENAQWNFPDKTGLVTGGYGLRLRVMDMAKLGQLYLQGGQWNDQPVLSSEWITAASRDQTGTGYGYYWWTSVPAAGHRTYAALGVRGQVIQVIPDLDLVFVMTSNLRAEHIAPLRKKLVEEFLIPAVASDTSLPEDTPAIEQLREELERAKRFRPAKDKLLNRPNPPLAPKE